MKLVEIEGKFLNPDQVVGVSDYVTGGVGWSSEWKTEVRMTEGDYLFKAPKAVVVEKLEQGS